MSSGYLTSEEMNLIQRLLAEGAPTRAARGAGDETAAARMLIRAIGRGSGEDGLRTKLARFRDGTVIDAALSRWDGEGGAIARSTLQ